jgi:hypothetical protein
MIILSEIEQTYSFIAEINDRFKIFNIVVTNWSGDFWKATLATKDIRMDFRYQGPCPDHKNNFQDFMSQILVGPNTRFFPELGKIVGIYNYGLDVEFTIKGITKLSDIDAKKESISFGRQMCACAQPRPRRMGIKFIDF